jgi:hypothetical protein
VTREPSLPLTGGCLCGGVRFELDAPLVESGWCHCTRCRRRTGTPASVQARIAPGSLRLVVGEELLRSYRPEDGFPKVFCGECGSSLWSQSPVDREVISVRLGAFDGDPGIRPSYHQFVADAAVWAEVPDDGLPRFPGRRPR